MRNLIILCLFLSTSNAIAATDLEATYNYQSGETLTIVTRDKQNVRIETSPTSYMLFHNDKVYSVNQDSNGRLMVMDMDELKAVTSSGFMSLFGGGGSTANTVVYKTTYKSTGKKEEIAGYNGKVYNVEIIDSANNIQREEVVLSSHADIKTVSDGWSVIAAKMGKILGDKTAKSIEKSLKEAESAGYGGILRYGNEMRLKDVKKVSLDSSYYELPAGAQVVSLGKIPNFNLPVTQQSKAGQVVEQDAKDVGSAAKQEAKNATIDEVRDGVRDIFNSLFD